MAFLIFDNFFLFALFNEIALTSLSNGPLFAQFTADLIFAAIADSRKLLSNEP